MIDFILRDLGYKIVAFAAVNTALNGCILFQPLA